LQVSPLPASLGKTPIEPLGSTQAAKLAGGCERGNADAYLPAQAATGEAVPEAITAVFASSESLS
jgi:hypothetical protein